jgi:thiol-disulfide isomerase/thioredoxin
MVKNNIEIESASRIAAKAVEMIQKDLDDPNSEEKPAYRTDQEWENQLRSNLGSAQDTIGLAFLKLGKEQEALGILEKAVLNTNREMTEINEHYSDALARIGNPEKALEEIGGFLQTEYSTARMKDLLKQAYVRKNGNDQGFDQYLKGLNEKFSNKLLADLEENIIKEPAPDFSLQDLEGNQVILSELKGKVVVLDFWATWCTYCLDSFPGMQETIKKYHGQDDIRFLFIDSWEYVEKEEKKQTVADLMAKKKLSFRVLLDLEDKVIEAYKIRSIPTKLIIDKEGNIRFKKIGFEGNTQKMVEELSRMIEMIR